MNGQPLIDDLDREFLIVVALAPSRLMALVRVTGSCRLTARRRVDRLVARGMVSQTDGRYAITEQGRAALGDQCPSPWVRPDAVAASLAKDVTARRSPDVMTSAEAGRMGARVRWRKASLMDERIAS
jgi:hypothetical protein